MKKNNLFISTTFVSDGLPLSRALEICSENNIDSLEVLLDKMKKYFLRPEFMDDIIQIFDKHFKEGGYDRVKIIRNYLSWILGEKLYYLEYQEQNGTPDAPIKIPEIPKTKLFKFPENLSKELEKDQPDVIGFSSYMWNTSLSDMFMKRIKEVFPKIITVSGGPNFPAIKEEQFEYLKKRPWIDYYIQ